MFNCFLKNILLLIIFLKFVTLNVATSGIYIYKKTTKNNLLYLT